jgi:hypothetical protein
MEGGGGVAGASDGGRHDGAGTGAPKHAGSMTNLASTYRNQGRWKEAEGLEVQVLVTAVTEGRVGSRNHHFDSKIGPWTVYKLVLCRSLSNKASKHSTLCFALNIAMDGEKSI